MDESKETLRAVYKQIRLRMKPSEVSLKSRMITRKLINEIDWTKVKKVCTYEPLTSLHEVNIGPLIQRLSTQTNLSIYTIRPDKSAQMPDEKFDLILIPCLAFDDENYRLGWGGGWYDKFLAEQPQALKIGLCYQNGCVKNLPHEPHDIPLDQVITEV